MTRPIPRILVAAVRSGSGKTTLALGLVAALKNRGYRVQTFKTGPDYLDPSWLAAASGRTCYNLDGWMSGREYVEKLFERTTRDADIAVIEGAMGLFDGAGDAGAPGSSAQIAEWLASPVVLVVDAHGMGQSISPLVAGFAGYRKEVKIRGVIANRCGSARHRMILSESLTSASLPPLIGAVPRDGFPGLPSRHLGLVTADPSETSRRTIQGEFAPSAEAHVDLDAIMQIARRAPALGIPAPGCSPSASLPGDGIRIAVARDEAFHFYYPDLFDELERRNCEMIGFSPLRDSFLPPDTDAVYLGGGYPEEFAAKLSDNTKMREEIRQFAASGRLVYAECGGLMYLSQAITLKNGERFPMTGILPSKTRMTGCRKRLGYVEVELKQPSLWGNTGDRLRGHEFHYSELVSSPVSREGWSAAYQLKAQSGMDETSEGFCHPSGRVLASYVHLHLAGRPASLDWFCTECVRARKTRLP